LLTRALIAGGVTALLFGIHPLRVESVVWVSERKDVLYVFFSLISVLSYLRYATSPAKKTIPYLMSFLFFLMAAMSKAMAVTLPLVLLLIDLYPIERIHFRSPASAWLRVLVEKIPFLLVSLAVVLINITIHERADSLVPLGTFSLQERIAMTVTSLAFYLGKLVWPSHLSPYYPYPEGLSFLSARFIGSLCLVSAMTGFSVFMWTKGKKIWLAVWAYYVIMILPVAGLIRFGSFFGADRYTYLMSIGPSLLAGMGFAQLWQRVCRHDRPFPFIEKAVIGTSVVFILITLGILTDRQIQVWHDSFSLWNYQIRQHPEDAFGYRGRAMAYEASHEFQSALEDFKKSLAYDPEHAGTYFIRAKLYGKTGEYGLALRDLDRAIEIKPTFDMAYNDRCSVFLRQGNLREAVKDCSTALEMNPENAPAYNNRGFAYYSMKDIDRAVSDYVKAIALDPGNGTFYRNRGIAYLALGRKYEAIRDFQKGAQLGDRHSKQYLEKAGMSG
jgi:Flp pilus assembly protein TadD